MKRGLAVLFIISIVLILSIGIVSAGWFSDWFDGFRTKITGKVTEKQYTTLYYPNVTLPWGNQKVCGDSVSINQFCLEKGYDGGEVGDAYSGGACVKYGSNGWYGGEGSGVSDTLRHAKCYENAEVIEKPQPCISCAAPPPGCEYINSSCTSCGTLVCEKEGPELEISPKINISIFLTKEDFYVGEKITLK